MALENENTDKTKATASKKKTVTDKVPTVEKQPAKTPRPDLTPELVTELEKNHKDQWVAVRFGKIIHSAENVTDLLKLAGTKIVFILHVPAEGSIAKETIKTAKASRASSQKAALEAAAAPLSESVSLRELGDEEVNVEAEANTEAATKPNVGSSKAKKVDLEEISSSTLLEELEEYRAASKKRRKWAVAAAIVIILLAVGIIVQGITTHMNTPVEPNENTSQPTELAPAQKAELASTINEDTANAVGGQIVEQYTESIQDKVTLATDTADVDEAGKTAIVYLATYANVPADFKFKESADFFKTAVKGFDGKWEYIETDEAPAGTEAMYSIKLYDTSANPTNPVIIQISYFVQAENNPNKDLTITISTTAY